MSVVIIITYCKTLSVDRAAFISELSDSLVLLKTNTTKGGESMLQVFLASLLCVQHRKERVDIHP